MKLVFIILLHLPHCFHFSFTISTFGLKAENHQPKLRHAPESTPPKLSKLIRTNCGGHFLKIKLLLFFSLSSLEGNVQRCISHMYHPFTVSLIPECTCRSSQNMSLLHSIMQSSTNKLITQSRFFLAHKAPFETARKPSSIQPYTTVHSKVARRTVRFRFR